MEAEQSQEFDTTQRDAQLQNICNVTAALMMIFEPNIASKENASVEIDLDRSNAYAGMLSTIYNYWRKNNNANVSARGNDHAQALCTYGNATFTVQECSDKIKETCPNLQWDFKLATPLIDVLTAFKMVWDECRLSAARFKLKVDNKNIEKGITFGLTNVHLPLLTGLTYKPERRAGKLRTLGPLTLAISLSAEKKMYDKLMRAFKESVRMLRMGESIAECLRDAQTTDECRSLFSSLGDLLLGSRRTNKIYFPLLFFVKSWKGTSTPVDFSGIQGFRFYNIKTIVGKSIIFT